VRDAEGAPLLELTGVSAGYGARPVLREVSFRVPAGGIVTLLGANGAGKSTTLRAISGLVRPTAGSIRFAGDGIGGVSPEEIVRRGVCHVPEGRRVFPRMSVEENLALGAYLSGAAEATAGYERVYTLFPVLAERRRQAGGTLSGGEQQMLAIGRALMGRPRLLLLDEPSLGLAPLFVSRIFAIIAEIHASGCAIVLVEQNARQALRIADHGVVLETGKVILEGPAAGLAADPRVREAYLGG
jgi:branched-chain amino acid transport system ATP-binding protein